MTPVRKAHIKFCKFEGALAIEIIYLNEKWYDLLEETIPSHRFKAKNGFTINCHHQASQRLGSNDINLCRRFLYLETDIAGFIPVLASNLIEALKDWAKNWGGWKDEPAIEPIIKEYEGGVVEVTV